MTKKLFHAGMMRMVGGYRFAVTSSDLGGYSLQWSSGALDVHPEHGMFAVSNSRAIAVFNPIEPMGAADADPAEWALVRESYHQKMLGDDAGNGQNRLTGEGVLWIDERRVIGSDRRNYRGQHDAQWVAIVDMVTGDEERITMCSGEEPGENGHAPGDVAHYGYNPQLAFGGGFTRAPQDFADEFLAGRTTIMAKGGYSVLGCPHGPSVASYGQWPVPIVENFDIDKSTPRDSGYLFPSEYSRPKYFKNPVGFRGYWTPAGVSNGAAWIDHPEVKGMVFMSTMSRGYTDYRSQGNTGGGLGPFCVADPEGFYTRRDYGEGRGGAGSEYWYADGPKGIGVRTMHVYDPDDLARGQTEELPATFEELPIDRRIWSDEGKNPTKSTGLCWDAFRNLLWVTARMANGAGYLAIAYELDPSAPDLDDLTMPEGWHINSGTGNFERIVPIGTSHNGLTGEQSAQGIKLTWTPSTLDDHMDWWVMRSDKEHEGYEVLYKTDEHTWTDPDPLPKAYYLVCDRVDVGLLGEVHGIRGKIVIDSSGTPVPPPLESGTMAISDADGNIVLTADLSNIQTP